MQSLSKIAYKIGFSQSLNTDSWSAYNKLSKFKTIKQDPREVRYFLNGYMDGIKAIQEVRREMKEFTQKGEWDFLAAEATSPIKDSCDGAVQGSVINA